jgi:hypothetical protein
MFFDESGEKFLVVGIGFDCDAVELRTLSKVTFVLCCDCDMTI